MTDCAHAHAYRVYRRETREEVAGNVNRNPAHRGSVPANDGGVQLFYCPRERGGCGKVVCPA